jgi:hypothetical protein
LGQSQKNPYLLNDPSEEPELKGVPSPEDGKRRVAILTPTGDHMHAQYVTSLVQMLQLTHSLWHDRLEGISYTTYGSSILPSSRYNLALKAIDLKATHLLWIDSDMRFPTDMLLRFLDRDELIVGVNAVSRRPPYRYTGQSEHDTLMPTNYSSTGLQKAYRMGFGIIWMSVEVLQKMEPPWFAIDWTPEMKCFRGEDISFFKQAAKAGFDFYVDHDLSKEVEHWGSFGFSPLMHDQGV